MKWLRSVFLVVLTMGLLIGFDRSSNAMVATASTSTKVEHQVKNRVDRLQKQTPKDVQKLLHNRKGQRRLKSTFSIIFNALASFFRQVFPLVIKFFVILFNTLIHLFTKLASH